MVCDECDLKCFFCHHDGQFSRGKGSLSFTELIELTRIATDFGVKQVKISGAGEPLKRNDVLELVKGVSDQHGIKGVSITTNGLRLKKSAYALKQAGLDYLRVSLFSLNPDIYARIANCSTKIHSLVISGIMEAIKVGLEVKLNVVLLKGVEKEIPEYIQFSQRNHVVVKLIELATPLWLSKDKTGLYASKLEPSIVERRLEKEARGCVKTAFNRKLFHFANGGMIEIHRYLCGMEGGCNYCPETWGLRVSSDGNLLPCFLSTKGISILEPLRNGNYGSLRHLLSSAIKQIRKPPDIVVASTVT